MSATEPEEIVRGGDALVSREGFAGLRVLVVEDNATNRRIIAMLLEKLGVAADMAENGQEALDWLARERYDMVLMDVQMPGMDGLETTRRIRAGERSGVRIPIVAMTANAMKGDREACLAAGMDGYLSKPISPAELERIMAFAAQGVPDAAAAPEDDHEKTIARTDVFDRASLLERVIWDEELCSRVVETFLDDGKNLVSQFVDAAERGDSVNARIAAHTLRGAASNVAAGTLASLASRAEETASEGDTDRLRGFSARLKDEWRRFTDLALFRKEDDEKD